MDSAVEFHQGNGRGSQYIADFLGTYQDAADLQATPKLHELGRNVDAILEDDPSAKIAVFTDFRRMLPYLTERLDRHGAIAQYHGGLNADQKAAVKERFSSDPECHVFLSTNAGGVGLDLPEAQYLINYDLPYSGGILAQRNSRHVRASSTHSCVFIVNLIAEDTVEERNLATLQLRSRVADAILDGTGNTVVPNTVDSLTAHLEKNFSPQ
nr:C-terminal helicase domain-containing protein [Streptomyces sp. CBMA29]